MTKIKTTYIYDDETDTAELTELEEIKNLKDFRLHTFEGDVYVKAGDYKKIAIENKTLKASRDYWKEKAERLQRENIELRNRLDAYELALNIWSKGQSELLMGKNYKPGFKNGMPTYDGSDLFK